MTRNSRRAIDIRNDPYFIVPILNETITNIQLKKTRTHKRKKCVFAIHSQSTNTLACGAHAMSGTLRKLWYLLEMRTAAPKCCTPCFCIHLHTNSNWCEITVPAFCESTDTRRQMCSDATQIVWAI